jgi:hypothetical protein
MYSPARTLGSWVRIPFKHGCLCLFCVCVRNRPCDGLIPRPRSPTGCFRLRNWSGTKRFTDALCSKWEQQKKKKNYYLSTCAYVQISSSALRFSHPISMSIRPSKSSRQHLIRAACLSRLKVGYTLSPDALSFLMHECPYLNLLLWEVPLAGPQCVRLRCHALTNILILIHNILIRKMAVWE